MSNKKHDIDFAGGQGIDLEDLERAYEQSLHNFGTPERLYGSVDMIRKYDELMERLPEQRFLRTLGTAHKKFVTARGLK